MAAIRSASLEFSAGLPGSPENRSQITGAQLADAISALFDRLEGREWLPIDGFQAVEVARMLIARHGPTGAEAAAWGHIREVAASGDRRGVEGWCWILDMVEEVARPDRGNRPSDTADV